MTSLLFAPFILVVLLSLFNSGFVRRYATVAGAAWALTQIFWLCFPGSPFSAACADAFSGVFPVEPIRTLDALHLASALELLRLFPDLTVLSFDRRIVENLAPLGLGAA